MQLPGVAGSTVVTYCVAPLKHHTVNLCSYLITAQRQFGSQDWLRRPEFAQACDPQSQADCTEKINTVLINLLPLWMAFLRSSSPLCDSQGCKWQSE